MNTCRLFTSGILFLFSLYGLIWNQGLPFSLPSWMYWAAVCYFAIFPIKDMSSKLTHSLYKGKQFAANYQENKQLTEVQFQQMKKKYDRGALRSIVF